MASAVVEQDRDIFAGNVGGDHVEATIIVQVSQSDVERLSPNRDRRGRGSLEQGRLRLNMSVTTLGRRRNETNRQ